LPQADGSRIGRVAAWRYNRRLLRRRALAQVYSLEGITPVVHPSCYLHPSAVLIGDVIVGPGVYIGPAACLRGDFGRIVIGEGANIQDTCVLHAFPDRDLLVEADGHVGHGAVLHGCVVRRNALIGINAVILNGAEIGKNCLVGANALVPEGMKIPDNSMVLGTPAKVVRQLDEKMIRMLQSSANKQIILNRRSPCSTNI